MGTARANAPPGAEPVAPAGLYRFGTTPEPTYQALVELAEFDPDAPIQLLKVGRFVDPDDRDAWFEVTPEACDAMAAHFAGRTRGVDLALDVNHDPNHRAVAWFSDVESRGADGLWARFHWLPEGLELARTGAYRYVSSEFGPHQNEATGALLHPVLYGAALTNRPYLKGMQPISLSEAATGTYALQGQGMPASASSYAYVPDRSKVSTWKLPIHDREHAIRAAQAIGSGGFRGQKASIPAAAMAGVKRKIRGALTRFGVPKDAQVWQHVKAAERDAGAEPVALELAEYDAGQDLAQDRDLLAAMDKAMAASGVRQQSLLEALHDRLRSHVAGQTTLDAGAEPDADPSAELDEAEQAEDAADPGLQPSDPIADSVNSTSPGRRPGLQYGVRPGPTTLAEPTAAPPEPEKEEPMPPETTTTTTTALDERAASTPTEHVQLMHEHRRLRERAGQLQTQLAAREEELRDLRERHRLVILTERVEELCRPDARGIVRIVPARKQAMLEYVLTLSEEQADKFLALQSENPGIRLGELGTAEAGTVGGFDPRDPDRRLELRDLARQYQAEHPGTDFVTAARMLLAEAARSGSPSPAAPGLGGQRAPGRGPGRLVIDRFAREPISSGGGSRTPAPPR